MRETGARRKFKRFKNSKGQKDVKDSYEMKVPREGGKMENFRRPWSEVSWWSRSSENCVWEETHSHVGMMGAPRPQGLPRNGPVGTQPSRPGVCLAVHKRPVCPLLVCQTPAGAVSQTLVLPYHRPPVTHGCFPVHASPFSHSLS